MLFGNDWTQVFLVDNTPNKDFRPMPKRRAFVITDETELQAISPEVAAALEMRRGNLFPLVLIILGIIAPIVFWRSRRALRRMPVPGAPTSQD